MSRYVLALLLLPVLLVARTAPPTAEITSFGWRGNDVVLTLSDSVGYGVDLASSDTSDVVLTLARLGVSSTVRETMSGVEAATGGLAISLDGPESRTAILTQRVGGATVLKIHGPTAMGYALLWRPYTRQLVIHTFNWKMIGYAEKQYYEGLIALEQGADQQAIEMLTAASAEGDARARAVLGSYFARRRQDTLSRAQLRDPRTAEEYGALAAVLLRSGDSVGAANAEEQSRTLLESNVEPSRRRTGAAPERTGREANGLDSVIEETRQREMILIISFAALGLLMLVGLVMLGLRKRRRDPLVRPRETHFAQTSHPHVRRTDTAGFRVVDRERMEVVPTTAEHAPSPESQSAPGVVEAPEPPARVEGPSGPEEGTSHEEPRLPTQAEELQERMRTSTQRPAPGEPTIDAARRLKVSRDNVELRRKMGTAPRGNSDEPQESAP